MFNDIHVGREDGNGNLVNQTRVPLAYGPRQKFLERLKEREELPENHVGLKLPRMSFMNEAPVYDPERQMTKLQKKRVGNKAVWSPAPYRIPFELMIMVRNEDEGLQIIEQILPYFKPSLGVRIKPVDGEPEITDELKIVLQAVSKEDSYEGDFTSRRAIIYTLTFDMLINIYSRVSEQTNVIKTAIVQFNDSDSGIEFQKITHAVTPKSADEDDSYTIEVTVTDGIES